MLNPREVQDVIDDVLGNKKDPLRLTRDFLKQVSDHTDRVHRLEKKLEALIQEKNSCGGNWARAYSVLDRIEEVERLVLRAKELLTATRRSLHPHLWRRSCLLYPWVYYIPASARRTIELR